MTGRMRFQRGALSLFWCAVLMAALSLAAMLALMSVRHERNLFAETLARFLKTPVLDAVRRSDVMPAGTPVRKCTMHGKTVYSNVDCKDGTAGSSAVELHDTRGIDAPRVPAADGETQVAPGLRKDLIERAVSR